MVMDRVPRAARTLTGTVIESISIGGRIAHSGRVTGGGERSLRSDGQCGRRGQEEIGADTRFMGLIFASDDPRPRRREFS